jgi:hypothetical protein
MIAITIVKSEMSCNFLSNEQLTKTSESQEGKYTETIIRQPSTKVGNVRVLKIYKSDGKDIILHIQLLLLKLIVEVDFQDFHHTI